MPHRAYVFEADRIKAMREMIVATTTQERKEALEKIITLSAKRL